MFGIETAICQRISEALQPQAGWSVYGVSDAGDRRSTPAAVIGFESASVADSKGGAVSVSPVWRVTLACRRSSHTAADLDQAVDAVIHALHGWQPEQAGKRWDAMRLQSAQAPIMDDAGLIGVDLRFVTTAAYVGQP